MKKILIVVIVLMVAGGYYIWHIYNKPVADTESLNPEITVSASELFADFELDEVAANTKYLGKTIEVTGILKSTGTDDEGLNLMMDSDSDFFGINCAMSTLQEIAVGKYKPGDEITVRGKCTGFIGDVVLVRCIVVD